MTPDDASDSGPRGIDALGLSPEAVDELREAMRWAVAAAERLNELPLDGVRPAIPFRPR